METDKLQTESRELVISCGAIDLRGDLTVPAGAGGLVIFAHGSGSSRHSSRNQAIAHALQERGLATLLFDLLTEEEERLEYYTRHLRFNIPLLAERLIGVTHWIARQQITRDCEIGYFGSSTGAAAALVAASKLPDRIRAVVSRGGRPDLAGAALERVTAATLLIVGELDAGVIELNQQAHQTLRGERLLSIIPGATHLFEEPGALEAVAHLASDWFVKHLRAR